jgi:hypothetical protein
LICLQKRTGRSAIASAQGQPEATPTVEIRK